MNRDRLLKSPFKLIYPFVTLHLIFKRDDRARIGTGARSGTHAHIVVELKSNSTTFGEIFIFQLEFPTAAVERPAVNGMKLLFALQVYGEIGFVSSFGTQDLDHPSVVLQVLSGAQYPDVDLVQQDDRIR